MIKIINFFLNFIMSILVLGVICIIIFSNTVLNKDYIKEKLKQNKFYDRTYSDIKENFENYTMQSGLELEILDGLFTKEKVEKDINLKIDSIYSGQSVEIETNSIKNELDNRINSALEKNNRIPAESEKMSIKKYEDAIVDSYKSGILYGQDFYIDNSLFKNVEFAIIFSLVIISFIIIVINKCFLKYIACSGISLVFSGFLNVSIKFLIEKKVQHILILDSKFSKFLINSLNDIINRFFEIGLVSIGIGIVLIILESLKKTIENKKY